MTEDSSNSTITQHDDIRELLAVLAQDRKAAKLKEASEGWTKYVSLMIVGLAVAAAIGSLKSAGFSSKAMLNQAKASDLWAYYQAKTIKQRLSELEARTTDGAIAQKALADSLRYREEEKVLQSKAEAFEKERDAASKHGAPLGFAIASLQVSIALASVCLITKKKLLWAASGILGAVGFGYLILGLYGV